MLVGSPTAATLALTGLTPSTAYTYYVVASDGAGNRSARLAAGHLHHAPPTPVDTTAADRAGHARPPPRSPPTRRSR